MKKTALISVISVFSLFLTLFANSSFAHNHGDSHMNYSSQAKSMIESGKTYHKDVGVVRRMHPEFMNHKRDKTLREGVRSDEGSLKNCVNCHGGFDTNNNAIRIDEEGQFCSDCHKKVGTTVDCFGCHKATSSGEK
jgi:predicted CXXCH cytochrome family protein